jgi:trehalose 6-phosphate phosphatase
MQPMSPPALVLQTRRCLLRPVQTEDLSGFHEVLSFPGFTDFLPLNAPRTLEETAALVQLLQAGWHDGSRYVFSAVRENHFAGISGLRPLSSPHTWNLGYWIHPRYWGQGLAGEIAEPVLDWGFGTLGIEVVRICYAAANERSQRVAEKLGARRTGEGWIQKPDGTKVPEIVCEITRAEWQSNGRRSESGSVISCLEDSSRSASAARAPVIMKSKNDAHIIDPFFEQLAAADRGLLLLDYDGTLAPFRLKRDEAIPYPGVAPLLKEIQNSRKNRLVIISGRAINDLIPLLGVEPAPEIWGSHGWERRTSDGRTTLFPMPAGATEGLAQAKAAAADLGDALEVKPASVALHWRGRDAASVAHLRETVGQIWEGIASRHELELKPFDGGLELRVPGRHKGLAVAAILEEMKEKAFAAAYLGDDLTDEDAFAALEGHGLRLLVRSEARPSRADARLTPPDELLAFLQRWNLATQPRPELGSATEKR